MVFERVKVRIDQFLFLIVDLLYFLRVQRVLQSKFETHEQSTIIFVHSFSEQYKRMRNTFA